MSNYNEFCKKKKCPKYIEWEYCGKPLISCKLIGETDNIDEFCEKCLFLDEIKLIKESK